MPAVFGRTNGSSFGQYVADAIFIRPSRDHFARERTDAASAREPGPCAVQPQRLRDGAVMQSCQQRHRRAFLSDVGMGFSGLALGAMLARDGVARAEES